MNRRQALWLAAAGTAGVGLAGYGAAFRLHRTPNRTPFLTDDHLKSLSETNIEHPRILFVGNSMILRNDLPAKVRALADKDGRQIYPATAAADGARLVETLRIPGVNTVLRAGWDAVVLQDFTKTPLRAIDRWASSHAIATMAKMATSARILLFPPWPAVAENHVYRDPGFMTARPDNPEDFANRTMSHYENLGLPVAPVPGKWLQAVNQGADLYHMDGHHPNEAGTAFVAEILWDHLKKMV